MTNVALIMMQKDEDELFWPWITYHGSKYGYENCYVFDNGSSSPLVVELLSQAAKLGVNVDYHHNTQLDFVHKNRVILKLIAQLRKERRHRVYFPLDCDEFLAVRDGADVILSGDAVRQHIEERYRDGDYYFRISIRYMNSPLEQDRFYNSPMQKVGILSGSRSGKVGHGFHMKALGEQYVIPTQIAYIEFHNRPHAQFVEAAKRKLAPFISDFSDEALRSFKGLGHHLTSYCLMNEEKYLRVTHTEKKLVDIEMSAEFSALGVKYPFLGDVAEA